MLLKNSPNLLLLISSLSIFLHLPLITANSNCNHTCGNQRLSYPFGFSSGCPIRLNCNSSEFIFLEEHNHQVLYVNDNTIRISLEPQCNRSIKTFSKLFAKHFAPSSTNAILLYNCSSDVSPCSIPEINVQLKSPDCANNKNISCIFDDTTRDGLFHLNESQIYQCEYLLSSISSRYLNDSGVSLDLSVMDLVWWIPGNCSCSEHADCSEVDTPDGAGHRCKCRDGFIGDGFPGGAGCKKEPVQKEKHLALKLAVIAASVVLFVGLLVAFLVIYNKRRLKKNNPSTPFVLTDPRVEVSYRDLHQATSGFSSDNLIGSGGFGSVYKGYLDKEERLVAIKVLKLEENGALKSFMVECKALRSVRHRNLVKLLTYCSSLDYQGNEFKALVFEFMGNESLQKWLNHENETKSLNFLQRMNIAIDVASALHYLHDLCEGSIIHRDLKPSNVLLDDDLVAHVSDFGLAKLFFTINDGSQSQISSVGLKGTIGYAPPEYGMGGMASKEGDVYSFGILVLELFSGKNPTHEMFINGSNLRDFVKNELSREREQEEFAGTSNTDQTESLLAVFKVGLACSAENPRERKKMGDVVKELHFIQSTFLRVWNYR